MHTYRADGFRDVQAERATDAAEVFAKRLARRHYGSGGYCRNVRLDSWTENGRTHVFEVLIGRAARGDAGATFGHNVWLHVTRRD